MIEKGVQQGCLLSLSLFNLYAQCIMRNAGLDELQAGIKFVGRNVNNFRYATLMAESKRNKGPLYEGEGGERKSCLINKYLKTKIMASGPITS